MGIDPSDFDPNGSVPGFTPSGGGGSGASDDIDALIAKYAR
jgi:hypothetical protein